MSDALEEGGPRGVVVQCGVAGWRRALQGEHEENDGHATEGIEGVAPAGAEEDDGEAGEGGADEASEVKEGGVKGDGVGQVVAMVNEFDEKGLAGGEFGGVDEASEEGEGDEPGGGDESGEGEGGEGGGLEGAADLEPEEEAAAVEAVGEGAGDRGEEENGDLLSEENEAEHERAASHFVGEPGGGGLGHPVANEGKALAAEKAAVITGL